MSHTTDGTDSSFGEVHFQGVADTFSAHSYCVSMPIHSDSFVQSQLSIHQVTWSVATGHVFDIVANSSWKKKYL